MRIGGRGAGALVVAAVLGIVGGLTAAFVVPQDPTPGAPGHPSAVADPLHLDAPLVDLGCDDRSILVVGWGSVRGPLAAAVADNRGAGVRYLRTDESCDTLYGPEEGDEGTPDYVVYLGPFDNLAEACGERLTLEHKGDNVTRLHAGNEIHVKCLCELPTDGFPVLSAGMTATAEVGMWVRGLQGMLNDNGRLPDDGVTGRYDEPTAAAVRRIQSHASVPADGVVDRSTWRLVRDRTCRAYNY